ncbi:hypothetical protein ACHIPZ_13830 [Antrihabitans sp. NCIMB 15449]|uniref:Uncharacterized protein n=1 Tax=Antrihabitans spumae TaxID=3373370 RepID=A0ABW7JQE4_9NOCA
MAEYVLTALRFDQIVSAPGQQLEYRRRRRGDVIELADDEALRLVRAGAVKPVESPTLDDHGDSDDHGDQDDGDDQGEGPPPASVPGPPKKTALVADWVDYAVAQFESTNGQRGLPRADAEALTKQDLIEALT